MAAWNKFGYEQARKALEDVRLDLERINPSAARSLAEWLEETLTLHRLGCPEKLRKTLFSTNLIESAFPVVEEKCGRAKKWQGGDMKLRWVASGLLFAEEQFRKVTRLPGNSASGGRAWKAGNGYGRSPSKARYCMAAGGDLQR